MSLYLPNIEAPVHPIKHGYCYKASLKECIYPEFHKSVGILHLLDLDLNGRLLL